MTFKIINKKVNNKGVRELWYLLPINEYPNVEVYLREFDKKLLDFLYEDSILKTYLFYVEKFPSPITKIRSYKGLLNEHRDNNFEIKINSNESYLGFLVEIRRHSANLLFDYFFTPNNCCLIKTESKEIISQLRENPFDFNFYDNDNSFWIDYKKLSANMPDGSKLYHFHVNPQNENELGIKEYAN